MANLTKSAAYKTRNGELINLPVAAATTIYTGSIVVVDGGYAKGWKATAAPIAGYALQEVANAGAAGALRIEVAKGILLMKNSAGADAIDLNMIGTAPLFMDNQTVAKTGTAGGIAHTNAVIYDVTSDGVWVKLG